MTIEKTKQWITRVAWTQLVLALAIVVLLIVAVDINPSGEAARGFFTGFREAVSPDSEMTYEDAGFYSFGPIMLGLFSIIAIVAVRRDTDRWMKIGLWTSLIGSLIGVLSGAFPVFQIALLALFFAVRTSGKPSARDHGKKTTD